MPIGRVGDVSAGATDVIVNTTPGICSLPHKAAPSSHLPKFTHHERDPISTRIIHQGPHGLHLVVQLERTNLECLPLPIQYRNSSSTKRPKTLSRKSSVDLTAISPVGFLGEDSPSSTETPSPKRRKTLRASILHSNSAEVCSIIDGAADNDDHEIASDSDQNQEHIRIEETDGSCHDPINRFFERIEDVESWGDSSQSVMVVLGDVMRHVQTLGTPDPDNAEHNALHDEIHREIAQIERLIHDYDSSLRRYSQEIDL